MKDLVPDIVRGIVETARPEKIILLGSRARGDALPDSDFDLLVLQESDEPGYPRDAALYLALAGLNAPVDVLTYTPEEVRDWSAVPQASSRRPSVRERSYMKEKAEVVRGWLRKAASDIPSRLAQTLIGWS